jgi:hypothetical protein
MVNSPRNLHEKDEIEDNAPDVCHHGVGFNEDCEDCSDELAAEYAEKIRATQVPRETDG